MKIVRVESWRQEVELTRPYTIARGTRETVELFYVRLVSDGRHVGLGSASPAVGVTDETAQSCAAALAPQRLSWLVGRDLRALGSLCLGVASALVDAPAARAAVDMALYDLFGHAVGVSVAELLGCPRTPLPTSITIGIQSTEQALADAREYLARGFTCLKVKLGLSFEEDVERLRRLREEVGPAARIRVDANEGYTAEETRRFAPLLDELDLDFIEQPMAAKLLPEIRALPDALRERIALDESVQGEADALELLRPPVACRTFVIKLMKSGGITPARAIAGIAHAGSRDVMWGCMDESVVSIAAALHVAYASPATRYLDLDGSFDLARDPAVGGFSVVEGELRLESGPGLGVRLDV